MNPTIKTAIPIFLLTQVGNVAMVIDLHSRDDSIAGCIVKACAIALFSIVLSVIIAGFVMAHIDGPFLSSRAKSPAQPRKKINWERYIPVIVGASVFILAMAADIAWAVASHYEGRPASACIADASMLSIACFVLSAGTTLAIYTFMEEL